MKCDICHSQAEWMVYAAYDDLENSPGAVHPRVARYPLPLIRACKDHLIFLLHQESQSPNTTGQWVIK